jgi:hypothetical protein
MRNQRPSQDEDRSYGRRDRMQERGDYQDDYERLFQNRGRGGDAWRSQEHDEGRFGNRDQSSRGGQFQGAGERDYSGTGSDMGTGNRGNQQDWMFDEADRRARQHDDDFHNWRSEQINKFEGDYQEWRNERRKKFAEEFEKWRTDRNSKQATAGNDTTQKKTP